jgi:hypothetical protein
MVDTFMDILKQLHVETLVVELDAHLGWMLDWACRNMDILLYSIPSIILYTTQTTDNHGID